MTKAIFAVLAVLTLAACMTTMEREESGGGERVGSGGGRAPPGAEGPTSLNRT